jgi:hypothetical protein
MKISGNGKVFLDLAFHVWSNGDTLVLYLHGPLGNLGDVLTDHKNIYLLNQLICFTVPDADVLDDYLVL